MKDDKIIVFVLPLEVGLVTGLAGAIVAFLFGRLSGIPDALTVAAGWGVAAGMVGFLGVILWLGALLRDYLIPSPVKETPAKRESLRVEFADYTNGLNYPGVSWSFLQGIDGERFQKMCTLLAVNPDLSMARFCGRGKLFSRSEYEQVREALISNGLARWRNPRAPSQGVELSAAGRAGVRVVCRETLPHQQEPGSDFRSFPGDIRRTRARMKDRR